MHIIKHAAYLGGYKLALTFEDGASKVADLEPQLTGEIFEPLRDTAYFSQFQLNDDTDTICWPNGADFSPDWLYEHSADGAALSRFA